MNDTSSQNKTDMFRFRINPEVRRRVEAVYEQNGLSLTQAINIFIQQSINAGGFPFPVTNENSEIIKAAALKWLAKELSAGERSGAPIEEAEVYRILGIEAERGKFTVMPLLKTLSRLRTILRTT